MWWWCINVTVLDMLLLKISLALFWKENTWIDYQVAALRVYFGGLAGSLAVFWCFGHVSWMDDVWAEGEDRTLPCVCALNSSHSLRGNRCWQHPFFFSLLVSVCVYQPDLCHILAFPINSLSPIFPSPFPLWIITSSLLLPLSHLPTCVSLFPPSLHPPLSASSSSLCILFLSLHPPSLQSEVEFQGARPDGESSWSKHEEQADVHQRSPALFPWQRGGGRCWADGRESSQSAEELELQWSHPVQAIAKAEESNSHCCPRRWAT